MNRRRVSIPRKETSFCFDLGQPAGECFLMLGEIDQWTQTRPKRLSVFWPGLVRFSRPTRTIERRQARPWPLLDHSQRLGDARATEAP